MKKNTLLIIISVFSLLAGRTFGQTNEDAKLQSFFQAYLDKHFEQQPLEATGLGDHRFDARLDDISPEARQGWRKLTRQTLKQLPQQINYHKLSRDGQIDYEILRNNLNYSEWYDANQNPFAEDARIYGGYLSDGIYMMFARSTLPLETNVSNALLRMAEFPRIIAEAKRSLTAPSKTMLETAIRQNDGAINFFERDIFNYASNTAQKAKLETACQKAVVELKGYQEFLKGPAMARAQDNNWRLGKKKFAEKFGLATDAGVTAEQNFKDAQGEFARVQGELYTVARQLWPRYFAEQIMPPDDAAGRRQTIAQVIRAVSQEHDTNADELLEDARATVDSIKQFIVAHDYLRLPKPDHCQVLAMPEFRRGNTVAYMDNAPPLDPNAPYIYAISPPPADWTPAQVNSFLEEYNSHMLKILTIHEAYPGHYVQLEYANRNPSLIRRVLSSGVLVEGWAVYGEVAMLNAGFGEGDLRLRLMQLKLNLRTVANSMLDYQMHCTQMTDAEAMQFLTEEAYQSEGEAKLKVIRSKQSSVQLCTYFVGRMALYRLRQTVQRELGDKFELGRYHDAVLSCGSVPPKYLPELVRRRLAEAR